MRLHHLTRTIITVRLVDSLRSPNEADGGGTAGDRTGRRDTAGAGGWSPPCQLGRANVQSGDGVALSVGLSRRKHHRANTPLCAVLKLKELTVMATKLYVGNLSPNTTENQILELFKQSGNVTSCQLIMDKVTNKSKGFAFVEMGSETEAAKAMADRNGKELDGRALKVNEAKPREERPPNK